MADHLILDKFPIHLFLQGAVLSEQPLFDKSRRCRQSPGPSGGSPNLSRERSQASFGAPSDHAGMKRLQISGRFS